MNFMPVRPVSGGSRWHVWTVDLASAFLRHPEGIEGAATEKLIASNEL